MELGKSSSGIFMDISLWGIDIHTVIIPFIFHEYPHIAINGPKP